MIQIADINAKSLANLTTSFCNVLSKKYGVTTGDLEAAFGNPYCEPTSLSYCVPAACTLMKVPSGATW